MRYNDGKLCLSKKEKGRVWKDHKERLTGDETDCNHRVKKYNVSSE